MKERLSADQSAHSRTRALPHRTTSSASRPTILVLVDGYLPGHKLGGPIRSVSAIVEKLGDEFDFRIITRDRDLGEARPYSEVEADAWQPVGKAHVYYASPATLRARRLRSILADSSYDLLYCNSLFSPRLTLQVLVLRRLHRIPWSPVIVAPRGELSRGALAIKKRKKLTFLAVARAAKLYGDVVWHASTDHERADILEHFNAAVRPAPQIEVAPILSTFGAPSDGAGGRRLKQAGVLRVVFLSRIARKKNLDGALRLLGRLRGRVEFTIYGPIEDPSYWAECRALIAALPPSVSVRYGGAVAHAGVPEALMGHDLFFLPTHGENFGHAISEALIAGCPVLISDQTPWRGLEAAGAGWDLPLSDERRIVDVLTKCVEMDDTAHSRMCKAAARLAEATANDAGALDRNRHLFRSALRETERGQ